MKINEKGIEAMAKVPLNISSTRRVGENGLRNADELVAAYLPHHESELVKMAQELSYNLYLNNALKGQIKKLLQELGHSDKHAAQRRNKIIYECEQKAKQALARYKGEADDA